MHSSPSLPPPLLIVVLISLALILHIRLLLMSTLIELPIYCHYQKGCPEQVWQCISHVSY